MLLLSEEDIVRALPLPGCILEAVDAVEEAERAHALGRTREQQRINLRYEPDGEGPRRLIVHPAIVGDLGAAVRTFTTGGMNRAATAGIRPRRLQGITTVYAYDDMGMIAVLEDGHVNDVRTAAPTGVAARHLCRADVSELAVIGTGQMALCQLAAVCAVLPITRVRAYSRTPEHVARFASEATDLLQIEVVPCASGKEAIHSAGAVITVTNARQPVIDRSWLSPGTTVLCIARNEVDEATIRDSRVFTPVTQRLLDPGEEFEPFATWVPEGTYGPADVTEIGEVVVGRAAGRRDPGELLTFCSTGSGYWDVAIPMLALRRARELGLGVEWP